MRVPWIGSFGHCREDRESGQVTRLHAGAPLVAVVLAVGVASGCGGSDALQRETSLMRPADVAAGERAYNLTCAECHGPAGRGTSTGPPLVHRIYEPSHHSDASFLFAVRRGVPAHHWGFGDMPEQPDVTDADVANIVAYARQLQDAAGIR